jgi:hypothetical protein
MKLLLLLLLLFVALSVPSYCATLCDPNLSTMLPFSLTVDTTTTQCVELCADRSDCLSSEYYDGICSLWSECVAVEWDDGMETIVVHK